MMASFQDIKKIANNEPQHIQTHKEPTGTKKFELEEARYMLNLIAKSDFKGSDVQTVYNIAYKLQDIIKETQN